MSTTISQHLRDLRKQTGLSQRDVAHRMGTSPNHICMIETGGRDPQFSTLLRYCNAIGARIYIGLPKEARRE